MKIENLLEPPRMWRHRHLPKGTCGPAGRAGRLMTKGSLVSVPVPSLVEHWTPNCSQWAWRRFEHTFLCEFVFEWVNARRLWITSATLKVARSIGSVGFCVDVARFRRPWLFYRSRSMFSPSAQVALQWTGDTSRLQLRLLGSASVTPSNEEKYQDISLKTIFKLLCEASAPPCCHWIPNNFSLTLTLQTGATRFIPWSNANEVTSCWKQMVASPPLTRCLCWGIFTRHPSGAAGA